MSMNVSSLAHRLRSVRPIVEFGQATVEWTTIAALVVTLMIPACFGVWHAAGGMYGSLDEAVDVTPATGYSAIASTYNINFYRVVMLDDGSIDYSTMSDFGADWNQVLQTGQAIALPPLSYGDYTFSHWCFAGDWNTPVSVDATCTGVNRDYVAIFK